MIYFLEFDPPLGNQRHSARFYCGWTRSLKSLPHRMENHRQGNGAAICRWAAQHRIQMKIIHIEPGTRDDERRIKERKNHAAYLRQKGVIA